MIRLFMPTPESVLREQLRDAKLDRLTHAKNAEYHTAMDAMLTRRIARLSYELSTLEQKPQPGAAASGVISGGPPAGLASAAQLQAGPAFATRQTDSASSLQELARERLQEQKRQEPR